MNGLLAIPLSLLGCSGPAGDDDAEPCCDSDVPAAGACEAGTVCTVAGVGMQMFNSLEGDPLEVGLFYPSAAVVDPDGRLVVVDYNSNVVRRIDDDGVFRTIVGSGAHAYAMDGAWATETPLEGPTDLVYADDGSMFVYEQHGARILEVDPTGWLTIRAGDPVNPGYDDCEPDGVPAREGGMTQGWGVTLGDDGTLYFAEPLVDRIRRVTPDGVIESVAGQCDPTLYHLGAGFVNGVGADARFRAPYDVKFHDGALYVTDTGNHAIRRIDLATDEVTTFAGTGVEGFSGDGGPALDAQLSGPIGMDFDPSGAMFVADSGNNVIRRIDPDGTITTVAGQATPSDVVYAGDGGPPLDARFNWPNDVHVLSNGDLVIVDTFNARVRVASGVAAAE